jgi:hypothetical protein
VEPAATADRTQAAAGRPQGSSGPIAWTPSEDLDANEWATAGRRIGAVGRCIQWLLGDWIAYGNERFGERYARASKITGYDPQTLMNMVYVASRFEISRRRENLSWSHHETIAALDHDDQDRWLDQAEANRWSVADLRMMLRVSRREGAREEADAAGEPPPEGPLTETAGGGVREAATAATVCPKCGYRIDEHAGGDGRG